MTKAFVALSSPQKWILDQRFYHLASFRRLTNLTSLMHLPLWDSEPNFPDPKRLHPLPHHFALVISVVPTEVGFMGQHQALLMIGPSQLVGFALETTIGCDVRRYSQVLRSS